MYRLLIIICVLLAYQCSTIAGEFYLGKYEVIILEDFDSMAPKYSDKLIGAIDIRPLSSQGDYAKVGDGYGFFEYSEKIADADFIYLGNDPNADLDGGTLAAISLGLGVNFSAKTPADILYEVLTTSNNKNKVSPPLLPDSSMRLKLFMGGKLLKSRKIKAEKSPEWGYIRKELQEIYRETKKTDPDLARQMLTTWKEKYHVIDTDQFIPDDLPKVKALPHKTTFTESFNTANSGTLGPDLSWTDLIGDLVVTSNECRNFPGISHLSRAESDVSSTDHYAQVTATLNWPDTSNLRGGPALRVSSTETTCYFARINFAVPDQYSIYKYVTGSLTAIVASTNTTTYGAKPFNIKFQADGTTLTLTADGVQRDEITDTAISTGTRGGVFMYDFATGEPYVDNYEISDLTVPGTTNSLVSAPGLANALVIRSMIVSATAASSMYFFHGTSTQVGPTFQIPANGTLALDKNTLDITFPENTAAKAWFSTEPNTWTYDVETVSGS